MIGFLRKVIRALAGPFLMPRRLEQLTRVIGHRFDRLEGRTIQRLIFQQNHLEQQIAQMAREDDRLRRVAAGEGLSTEEAPRILKGAYLPLEVEPPADTADAGVEGCPKHDILILENCPVCGSADRTIACRFNKMIIMRRMPDQKAAIYEYALCHQCGLLYASRRPAGARYAWLLERFEENLGRTAMDTRRAGKVALNSYQLDDHSRARLREMASHGVFVSEHLGLTHKDYLWQLQADRFANSRHLELLGSLLTLRSPRVLDIRSRLGSILVGLRRLYDAEVFAIPLFPNQQLLIKEVYDIPTDATVNFDHFTVPYEPPFDLVLSNHMLTHAVRPGEFLATVHAILKPGGHVYFYNEPDEAEYLIDEHSMFNTLNAFHLQGLNRESLVRVVNASGFEVLYVGHDAGNFVCLARKVEGAVKWKPMAQREFQKRIEAYRWASDLSVLLAPEYARPRFSREWPEVLDRARARGFVAPDSKGRLRVMRRTDRSGD